MCSSASGAKPGTRPPYMSRRTDPLRLRSALSSSVGSTTCLPESVTAFVLLARGRHACLNHEHRAHASACIAQSRSSMRQESFGSVCDFRPAPRPDPRDLLCAMLRSAEGGNSDSGGSEVSPSHKRRSARLVFPAWPRSAGHAAGT